MLLFSCFSGGAGGLSLCCFSPVDLGQSDLGKQGDGRVEKKFFAGKPQGMVLYWTVEGF